MTERYARFFVCDELLVSLNGKFTISGLYTGDLIVPADPIQLAQLVVVVTTETEISKPFRSVIIRVQLPGDPAPRELDASSTIPPVIAQVPGRSTIKSIVPFLITQPVLRSGPIEVKVIHEEGELLAGKQWIVTSAQLQELQASATEPKT
jgi:hypothetical protein